MSGTVETELRKLEKIVPGLLKAEEKMEMVSFITCVAFLKEGNETVESQWNRWIYQEEILELTVAYIADLQNHLVGRLDNYKETTKQIQKVKDKYKKSPGWQGPHPWRPHLQEAQQEYQGRRKPQWKILQRRDHKVLA